MGLEHKIEFECYQLWLLLLLLSPGLQCNAIMWCRKGERVNPPHPFRWWQLHREREREASDSDCRSPICTRAFGRQRSAHLGRWLGSRHAEAFSTISTWFSISFEVIRFFSSSSNRYQLFFFSLIPQFSLKKTSTTCTNRISLRFYFTAVTTATTIWIRKSNQYKNTKSEIT